MPPEYERSYPRPSAVLWAGGYLWTANESGLLTRWDVTKGEYKQYRFPGEPAVRALATDGRSVYAGTDSGGIWRLDSDGSQAQIVAGGSGPVSALAFDREQNLWYVETDPPELPDPQNTPGRGLIFRDRDGPEKIYHPPDDVSSDGNPLQDITALAFDDEAATLWIGTRSSGLLSYHVPTDSWQIFNTGNSALGHDTINDLQRAPDRSLWLATAAGVSTYSNGTWNDLSLTDDLMDAATLSVAVAKDGTVWLTGKNNLGRVKSGQANLVYHTADNPLLRDRAQLVALDDQDHPWFIGRRGRVHFDGQTWIVYDADARHFVQFTPFAPPRQTLPPPTEFPSPSSDYVKWLQAWPRPQGDNGRGMHFLQTHQFDEIEAQKQVNRLNRLGVRWTVVNYTDHDQLIRIAPIFQGAGITVVWRPFIRPFETYDSWTEDVAFLRSRGIAPYFQLYNEPSLAQEWDADHPIDQETYWRNLLSAAQEVYAAGGYVGLQFVDPGWLRSALQTFKSRGLTHVFDRLFFVPHPYGLNHPPEYDEDINSVLGFRRFAQVFQQEIGFVPVMIAGEGGWRLGEAPDDRYPAISEELHRDYYLAVFDWFHTGTLSNGEALPDYLFAFCPWLISDPADPAAWFDSASGDRSMTIAVVEAMPPFERRFWWDQ